jgi:hypothetical protein
VSPRHRPALDVIPLDVIPLGAPIRVSMHGEERPTGLRARLRRGNIDANR